MKGVSSMKTSLQNEVSLRQYLLGELDLRSNSN